MTKRIVSFLLSAVMAAGLCVPAFAAEAGGGGADVGVYIGGGIGGLKDTGETTADVPGSGGRDADTGADLETPSSQEPVTGTTGEDYSIPDGMENSDQKATGAINGDSEYATPSEAPAGKIPSFATVLARVGKLAKRDYWLSDVEHGHCGDWASVCQSTKTNAQDAISFTVVAVMPLASAMGI